MRLKLSLGQRLFAAALLAFALVAGAGLELVRWQFLDNFADAPATPPDPRQDALARSLAALYAQRHDWSFLPVGTAARTAWLRAQVIESPESPVFGSRLGLTDVDGRLIAGVAPGALLVALTAIDARVVPLRVDGRAVGRLVLANAQRTDDDLAVAFLLAMQGRLGLVALLAVLAAVVASAVLAAGVRRPVRALVAGARELDAGRFDARLPTTRGDELGQLAHAFNHLAARLAYAERARMRWLADTSHELRTPLAVLRGQLEALQDGVRRPTPDTVAAMHAQVMTLTRLVDDLQALTPPPLAAERVDAWAVFADATAAFADRIHAAGLTLAVAPSPARSTIAGDADRLRQLATNLLENSVRHTDAGGSIEITSRSDDRALHLIVDDTAPGVPDAALARLGERFFRVDASRSRRSGGSGLGLAVSRQIVEAHGGTLRFEPSPRGGLRAIVTVPLEPR